MHLELTFLTPDDIKSCKWTTNFTIVLFYLKLTTYKDSNHKITEITIVLVILLQFNIQRQGKINKQLP